MSGNLVRAVRGPLMLILVGTLFAFDRFSDLTIGRTWPVFLIALGILLFAERAIGTRAVEPGGPQGGY